MMKKRNDCIQYLDEIIGKAICAMGRAANMLWIGIGEKFATTDRIWLHILRKWN